MIRYIAFLRGINVGGKNIIKMNELVNMFQQIGLSQVRTFIQSGNVFFESKNPDTEDLTYKIETHLFRSLGCEIPVMLRMVNFLVDLIHQKPFNTYMNEYDVKLYVCFLKNRPEMLPDLPLKSPKDGVELFRISDLEAFIVSRTIKGRFGFPNNFIEKELRVPSTARNWNTIVKMMK